jgi:hypothetical protein
MINRFSLVIACVLFWSGCAIGLNRTLFVTKSNIGVDVDTKPPVAQIDINRFEGVVSPGFEGGTTPPVLASFATHVNPFEAFFFGVSATFAGGDAAVGLANDPGKDLKDSDSQICVTTRPQSSIFGLDASPPKEGEVKPFFFTTDTSFGLKLAWTGTAAQFPDTVRLGFTRTELALAPVFQQNTTCKLPNGDPGTVGIKMPPFLAVIDNNVKLPTTNAQGQTEVKTGYIQHFATGKAAAIRASQEDVQKVMQKRLDPGVYAATFDVGSPTTSCIEKWLNADPGHPKELRDWWTGKGFGGNGVLLIDGKNNSDKRDLFIREKNIACD